MASLRTENTEHAYDEMKKDGLLKHGCPLCNDPHSVAEFTHWRIIRNAFPYDRIAQVHDLLIPKRHATDAELSQEEWDALQLIKRDHIAQYDHLLESTSKSKTIPDHYHLHLIVIKDSF